MSARLHAWSLALAWMVLFGCALDTARAAGTQPLLLLRYPTLSKTEIAFEYGGELWEVPRAGAGTAGATSGAIVHPARGIRQRPPSPAGPRRPHGGGARGTSRVAASLLALGVGRAPPGGGPRQPGIPSS